MKRSWSSHYDYGGDDDMDVFWCVAEVKQMKIGLRKCTFKIGIEITKSRKYICVFHPDPN